MQVLTETEQLILTLFHEKRRDRAGAEPGQTLPLAEILHLDERFPPEDVQEALDVLIDRKLLVPEADGASYAITRQGVDYLYSGAGVGAFSHAGAE